MVGDRKVAGSIPPCLGSESFYENLRLMHVQRTSITNIAARQQEFDLQNKDGLYRVFLFFEVDIPLFKTEVDFRFIQLRRVHKSNTS